MRGPGVLPRQAGRPAGRTRAERFDALVVALLSEIDQRWHDQLGLVEYAVEDAPQIPDDWIAGAAPGGTAAGAGSAGASVPLSALVRPVGSQPARIVLFRRPIEHRSPYRDDLEALVHTVLVEQVAELLGIDPHQVDPRYPPPD